MGRLRAWRRWAVTGLVLALVFTGAVPRPEQVSADPGDNGTAPPPVRTSAPAVGGNGLAAGGSGDVGPAVAVPISTVWNEFQFGAAGSFATGCIGGGCVGPGVNSVFVGDPPWTFTAPAGGAVLQVTDAFLRGDRFEIFDGGVSIGMTSLEAASGTCGPDPDPCWADPANSTGSFPMAAGAHSITIQAELSPFGSGAAYFRVVLPPTPTCTLTQTASHAGGMTTLSYTIGNSVPATWNLYLVLGTSVVTIASAPLPAISPPIAVGPFSFPFPSSGVVGWLTTLTTPSGGIICADFDLVNTGAGPAPAPVAPRIEIPLPFNENGQQ